MLRVSEAQLELLWLSNFTDRMVVHLRKYFEKPCAMAGEACVRNTIHRGVARARKHGLTLEATAQSYLDHMIMLGSHFDRDPMLPWAHQILAGPGSEVERMDALHAATMKFLAATAGKDARQLFFAIARARHQRLDPGFTRPPADDPDLAARWLHALYPEKYRAVAPTLPHLIRYAQTSAVRFGFEEPRAMARILGVMFLLGAGALDEPMAPWIGAIVTDVRRPAHEREEELWSRIRDLADRWIAQARAEGTPTDVP